MRRLAAHTGQLRDPLGLLALLLLLALAAMAPLKGQAAPLELATEEKYSLNGAMELLEDRSGTLELDDVEAAYGRGEFRPLEGELSAGFSRSVFWLRFELQRRAPFPETGWLRLWPVYTEHMALYLPGSGREPVLMGSADMPGSSVAWLPEPAVPVGLSGNAPVVGYLRMQGDNSIALDASIHAYRDLLPYANVYLSRIAAYIGFSLLVMFIALIAYRASGARYFLLFAGYVCTLMLTVVPLNGMNSFIFPDWTRPLMAVLLRTLIAAAMLLFMRFSLAFFERLDIWWARGYFQLMSALALAAMLFSPTPYFGTALSIAMFCYASLVPALIYLSLKADMPSRGVRTAFLAAIVSTLLGHILFFFHLMGWVGGFALVHDIVQFSSTTHIVLLLPALALRIRFTQEQAIKQSALSLERAEQKAARLSRELREHSDRLEASITAGRSAAERMEQFLMMVAHDYRTPLNVIHGNLELLERWDPSSSRKHDSELRKIRRAAGRLEEMVEVSLAQGRITDSHGAGSEACIDLHEFVRHQVAAASLLWPERQFLLDDAEGDELVFGELSHFDTALFNLLDNAQKYAPDGTPVTITCRICDGRGAVTVANRISSLPDDELETLFEQFHRGPNASGTAGAGLGLSIVRSIAERYGGGTEIRKTPDGNVAATLFLPIVEEERKTAP